MARDGHTQDAPAALAALAPTVLLGSLGISIATVALPTLTRAFSAGVADVQWVILVYLLSATVTIVQAGRLGDLFGHRRVLIAGLVIFAVASLAAAGAPTLGLLIAARAAQGIGGAILMALPISIVRDTIAVDRTGSAMGLLGTMSAVGTALGPSVGGLIISGFGWRAAFIGLAILGLAILILTLRVIPETPARIGHKEIGSDLPGAGILAVALTAYALATAGKSVDLPFTRGAFGALAVIGLGLFVVIEMRTKTPLVPVALLRDRAIGLSLIANLLVTTVMMATLVVGPFFLSFALGLNDAVVGLVMAVGPVTAALAGIPAGRITDQFGTQRVLAAGLIEMIVGLIALALLPREFGVPGYVFALILLTPGFQLFLAANNTAVMFAAPADKRGVLSGLLGLSRNLGFMTGASVMAAIFASFLGRVGIANADADRIADAFSATFLIAAGLTAAAFLAAIIGNGGRRARAGPLSG